MLKSKKILALLVVLAMVSAFAACGQTPSVETAVTNETAAVSEAAETSAAVETAVESPSEVTATGFEGPTTPSKAPEGIKLAIIMGNASMSGASIPADAMMEIAEHYGWEYQTWDGAGSPDVENTAIMSAISWGADAILTSCIQASTVQTSLKAATEAGIPVGSCSTGTDTPNPVIEAEYNFAYDVGASYYAMGHSLAEWIKANTEASGIVACWDFEGEFSIDNNREGLYAGFNELGVEYDEVGYFTFDQLGDQLNRQVTTYLTNNPDTEFIFFPFDPAAVPVSEALELAGYTDVKVVGVLGNIEMCALISQGTVASATAAYDNSYLGYACVDQMIRVLNGDALFDPHGENVPYAIIDATNVPADGAWAPDFDYKASFYALWD